MAFIAEHRPVTGSRLIDGICEFILENPGADLRLKTVAERFYVNHAYLCSIFPQKAKTHYAGYVEGAKMLRAKYLLEATGSKVQEICHALGYSDANYFSRVFKKRCGKSPSEYRQAGRGGSGCPLP
ncbi:MAG: AraC family transcriptional regulator [Clostridiales bacterium]|nr:AraC family transcriptional regulator [Clostridiales bacterium]